MGIPEYLVEEDESGVRLDSFLALQDDLALSRSYISTLVRNGHVRVDGEVPTKPSTRLQSGQVVAVMFLIPSRSILLAENIPLDVVYEDDYLIVIDKPAGLVVHPTPSAPGAEHWSMPFSITAETLVGDFRRTQTRYRAQTGQGHNRPYHVSQG